MLRIGQCYQWSELPGKGHGYVRFENGHIVCANLKPELNPDAPKIILVGQGLLREKWARMLCESGIPSNLVHRFIYLQGITSEATNRSEINYFPMQNWLKIESSKSFVAV
jgi:hypothetical protein